MRVTTYASGHQPHDISAAGGRPAPGQVSPLDVPDDFFRVRLICVLLDAVGMCFDRGSLKRRLDDYLVLFQVIQRSCMPTVLTTDLKQVLCTLQRRTADGHLFHGFRHSRGIQFSALSCLLLIPITPGSAPEARPVQRC